MSLGSWIKSEREKRGWTREKLAQRVGVLEKRIYKWEKGFANPSTDNLVKLENLFNIGNTKAVISKKAKERKPQAPKRTPKRRKTKDPYAEQDGSKLVITNSLERRFAQSKTVR